MIRFRPNGRGYFRVGGSVYIGSGNKMSVITRRSRPAFSKLKQYYGENMENLNVQHHELRPHHAITQEVRWRVKKQARKEQIAYILRSVLSIVLALLAVVLMALIAWRIFT